MISQDGQIVAPATSPANAPAEDSPKGNSGSGASTALTAMLKKRQQRAGHDADPPRTNEDEVVLRDGE